MLYEYFHVTLSMLSNSNGRALGCLEPQCELCKHNTARRCSVNFDRKYLVNDKMTARCGSTIRIELVDRATGAVFEGELPDVHLEVGAIATCTADRQSGFCVAAQQQCRHGATPLLLGYYSKSAIIHRCAAP